MYSYSGYFADIKLAFLFSDPDTAHFYGSWLRESETCSDSIMSPETDIFEWQQRFHVKNHAYAEYVISCGYACNALLERHRMVFHGVSFLWNGSGYIFTAPSGTGKTTQIRNWQQEYGDEVALLNGDKPILEFQSSGEILIHPSPWKGKEGYGRDDIIAP